MAWSKKKTMKAFNKAIGEFKFTYAINYDGEVYSYNVETGSMRINPIPIIIEYKNDEGKVSNLNKINYLRRFINRDLKKAMFKFRNGQAYDVANLMSPIATLLGIQYSLKKLYERELNRNE